MLNKDKKIAIVTCCLDDWGGSEELWFECIPHLQQKGIRNITVYKNQINNKQPQFVKLMNASINLTELLPKHKLLKKSYLTLIDVVNKIGNKIGVLNYQWNKSVGNLYKYLKASKPDLVLISQGINFDGLAYARQCLILNIPYLIVSHKAVEFFWPGEHQRAEMRETLLKARKSLYVSKHNLKLTEEQFGIRLKNSAVIVNPVREKPFNLPFPDTKNGFKLACIGRLFVIDKGQDILLRVLSNEKWRNRTISISFIGKGPNREALIEMAHLLELKNVSFDGFDNDLKSIWTNHHALILPSRSEGLPLTIIEAMSLSRICIVTNAGGNAEIIENGITGFVGEANENGIDDALENAWQKRNDWEIMGLKACDSIKKILPDNPEKIFSELIIEALNKTDLNN